jgi:hypothetical protein
MQILIHVPDDTPHQRHKIERYAQQQVNEYLYYSPAEKPHSGGFSWSLALAEAAAIIATGIVVAFGVAAIATSVGYHLRVFT